MVFFFISEITGTSKGGGNGDSKIKVCSKSVLQPRKLLAWKPHKNAQKQASCRLFMTRPCLKRLILPT